MKIIIPGGSGQVGTVLARELDRAGHEVTVLSRSATRLVGVPWRVMSWDGKSLGDWARELDGADAVVNLAGRSVNCRYHAANWRSILESRVDSTRLIGEAIARSSRPPRVWLQASTATIYAHRYDAANDDLTGIIGGAEPDLPDTWRFSYGVAAAWERTIDEAITPQTRKVKMRSAIVMSPSRGGAFDALLGMVRRGLGGRTGDGKQFVSWIHEMDFVRAVLWTIEHDSLAGAVNFAAPNPLPNADFMRGLRVAWGIRVGLPASVWMLELATWLMRTESELVLKSRRVVSTRLMESGFKFEFPTWPEAARDLCRRWRESHARITGAVPR
jgi:uncharacterized protein (TIGR01777 family)